MLFNIIKYKEIGRSVFIIIIPYATYGTKNVLNLCGCVQRPEKLEIDPPFTKTIDFETIFKSKFLCPSVCLIVFYLTYRSQYLRYFDEIPCTDMCWFKDEVYSKQFSTISNIRSYIGNCIKRSDVGYVMVDRNEMHEMVLSRPLFFLRKILLNIF